MHQADKTKLHSVENTDRDNLIYLPDFCQIVLDRMRNPTVEEVHEDDNELNFRHIIFKVIS